jgi:DNA-binding beta-propeller fold protein YncE
MATDVRGNVYVADTGSHRIQKLSARDRLLAVFGDTNLLSFPYGLSVDADGDIYVADELANRVVKIAPQGQILATWRASAPVATAVGAQDTVFVLEGEDGRIKGFSFAGKLLTTLGGRGSGAGQFASPSGIAVDSQGDLYVTDTNNHRVQKFTLAE